MPMAAIVRRSADCRPPEACASWPPMLAVLLSLLLCAPAEPDRLANARSLVAAGKYADALVDLQAVSQMYGNTPREQAELFALRASALLGLLPSAEHRLEAVDALTQM